MATEKGILRVHRGSVSSRHVIYLGDLPLGVLDEPVMDFTVPAGTHVITAGLLRFHSAAVEVEVSAGAVVEVVLEKNPEAASALQPRHVLQALAVAESAGPSSAGQ